ncbi:hypothetical protein FRC03_003686 [Tulasnella sp. 419]|nr:hypothetical protein FRC03_003686 [Tulasnella sp. 419]
MGYYIVLTLVESECRHFPGRAFVRHSTGILLDSSELQDQESWANLPLERNPITLIYTLRLRHADVIINGSRRKISFDLPLQWGQCRGFSDILLRCVRNKVQNRRDL